MYGWTGVIQVDLTERKLTRLRTYRPQQQFIGGRGIGAPDLTSSSRAPARLTQRIR
jgi:hypothetical protein